MRISAHRVGFPVMLTLSILSSAVQSHSQSPSAAPAAQLQEAPKLATRPAGDTLESHRRIVLDVVATDATGTPVADLEPSDFTVFDNNVQQRILSFHRYNQSHPSPDSPLQVVLILDAVNTSYQEMVFVRQNLEKFLSRNNGVLEQPTSLVIVTDTQMKIQPNPTHDGKAIIHALEGSQNPLHVLRRASGGAGDAERMSICLTRLRALADLQYTKPGHKVFLWIGPGWPSLALGTPDLTDRMRQDVFDAVIQLQTRLRESRVTLYNINSSGSFYYKSFLKPLISAKRAEWPDVMAQVVAVHTGGLVVDPGNDIADGIVSCLKDATAWYSISFDSPPTERVDEFHQVDVRTNRPGLTIRTSYGYYNQP
jgi:VWFA-related protein